MRKNKYSKIIFVLIILNISVGVNLFFMKNKFTIEKKEIENKEPKVQAKTIECSLNKTNITDETNDLYKITYDQKDKKIIYYERIYSIKCESQEEFEALKKMDISHGSKTINEESKEVTFLYDQQKIWNDQQENLHFETLKNTLQTNGYTCQ